MGVEPGCLIAFKILYRGKGVYILSIISTLLLYYSVFIKHPKILDTLTIISALNVATAILSDSDSHNTVFYALRISGAKPSTVMAYVITASLTTSFIGLIPVVAKAELIKSLIALSINFTAATLILYPTYLRIKKRLTSAVA